MHDSESLEGAARIEELEIALVQPEDLKPVQVKNTEARKVSAFMFVILEQMSLRFVYSRRMEKFT